MVIGNGLLANAFDAYREEDRFLIFASGVSNSKTKNNLQYEREILLLKETIHKYSDKLLVYFSTCSIYDPEENGSPYVQHKLAIEEMIRRSGLDYQIFRVSNVAGATSNPNTVLNYFYYHILNGINFDLWVNACRNIIDIEDVFRIADQWLQKMPKEKQTVNIALPFNYPVKEIVKALESHLGKNSDYIEVAKGNCFTIDLGAIESAGLKTISPDSTVYLQNLLIKYF